MERPKTGLKERLEIDSKERLRGVEGRKEKKESIFRTGCEPFLRICTRRFLLPPSAIREGPELGKAPGLASVDHR